MGIMAYDSYRIKESSTKTLFNFVNDLKDCYIRYMVSGPFYNEVLSVLYKLTQEIIYYKYMNKINNVNNTIFYYSDLANYESEDEIDLQDAVNVLSSKPLLNSIASIITNDNYEDTFIKDSFASISLYRDGNKGIVFSVYGKHLRELFEKVTDFNDISDNIINDIRNILSKYELADFRYSDDMERFEDISEKDWLNRKETWESLIKTGVSLLDGINIIVMNNELMDFTFVKELLNNIEYYYELIKSDIEITDKTRYKTARDLAFNEYLTYNDHYRQFLLEHFESITYDGLLSIKKEFDDEIDPNNLRSSTRKNIDSITEKFKDISIDFSNKLIKSMLIDNKFTFGDFLSSSISTLKAKRILIKGE